MKYQFNKQTTSLVVMSLLALHIGDAAASTSFTNYATISFSIDNIVGTTNDFSTLEMSSSFMRSGDGFPLTWVSATGDGSVTDNNPEIPFNTSGVSIGNVYSHTFALDGQVANGVVDFNQVGWYDLGFINNGSDSFDITLKFSYDLFTGVVGQNGTTNARIEYWDDFGDVYGLDEIVATTQMPELADALKGNEGLFTFTVDPLNSSRMLYLNVNHYGRIEASPVPLPAAVWTFLAGLIGVLGIKKHKRPAEESV